MSDGEDQRMETDSRKRSYYESDHDQSRSKRTNANGDSAEVLLKQLIPGTLAGALLGKGGETISKIQADTNTFIKMSKAGDFFPGTTDRVCIITGLPKSVKIANKDIWDRLRGRIDASSLGEECKMKLVVPHATVGMIIGKGGSYIKQIKETSEAFIQISQKATDTQLLERVVTIAGSWVSMFEAFEMVFKMIADDPQSGSCPNISYADYRGPVPNANPVGSPYAIDAFMTPVPQMNTQPMRSTGHSPPSASTIFKSGGPQQYAAIEVLKSTLRNAGHSVQATDEITAAMCTLANYGLLGMGLGYGPYGYGIGSVGAAAGSMSGGLTMEYLTGILRGASGVVSGAHMVGVPPQGNVSPDGFGNGTDGFNGTGFGGGHMRDSHEQITEELQVAEALVGAVLGHGGKAIIEIQKMTGATVHISKKGVFAPGTRNRVVTVSGSRPGVERALYHIRQCIQQEEEKRSRQDSLMKM